MVIFKHTYIQDMANHNQNVYCYDAYLKNNQPRLLRIIKALFDLSSREMMRLP